MHNELDELQKKLNQSDDFLEAMELLSQIEDLRLQLGLTQSVACNREDPECLSCGS